MNAPIPDIDRVPTDHIPVEVPARNPVTGEIITYTPGYVPHKIVMILVSLLIVGLGATQLVPALALISSGKYARAEAEQIVRTREGEPDAVLTKDADWKAADPLQNRAFTFWNVFRFKNASGEWARFRAPVGSVSIPPHPLLDADGLPTEIPIFFDPKNPARVVLPAEFSTWFFPGTLALFGLIGVAAGSLLLAFARKPIVVPHVVDGSSLPAVVDEQGNTVA